MRLAPEPTNALPGTAEKVSIMAWRAEHGYFIFHPLDATYDGESNMASDYSIPHSRLHIYTECEYD